MLILWKHWVISESMPQVHRYPRSGVVELRVQVVDWADSGLYTCKTNTGPSRQETFQVTLALAIANPN